MASSFNESYHLFAGILLFAISLLSIAFSFVTAYFLLSGNGVRGKQFLLMFLIVDTLKLIAWLLFYKIADDLFISVSIGLEIIRGIVFCLLLTLNRWHKKHSDQG